MKEKMMEDLLSLIVLTAKNTASGSGRNVTKLGEDANNY